MTHTIDSAAETSAWWRAALGEYPTGVCLVTGVAGDGSPVGMVVGSFVAVSEDPPLVGFFAGRRSSKPARCQWSSIPAGRIRLNRSTQKRKRVPGKTRLRAIV